ncbi:outer membrane lipoprotein-sorting protein [Candidatus Binatia bacterium]|nr:outer membrane lipoprotein-sorting protein [Candidatus Binatia bacterium]
MHRVFVAIGLSVLLVPIAAPAVAAESARAILDRARALDDTTRAWTDRVQLMSLTIHEPGGGTRVRELKVFTKRSPGGGERAVSFFVSPREVEGVGFLQWSRPDADAEQWLYLPELKRTRQIAARLRDESFMSTDLSYRDLDILAEFQRWPEAVAPSRLAGTETVDGNLTDVVELRPTMAGMPYGRIVVWMDRADLTPRRLEFRNADDTVAKTVILDDIRPVGAIPTPHRLEMRTAASGSRTVVTFPEVKYDTDLADELFTQRALERGLP